MRALVVTTLFVIGCGGTADGSYDYASSKGAALYQQLCQSCHGETGEGGIGPKLQDTARGIDELRATIAQRMPANDPGQCMGDCADAISSFIVDGLASSALA